MHMNEMKGARNAIASCVPNGKAKRKHRKDRQTDAASRSGRRSGHVYVLCACARLATCAGDFGA